MYNRKIEQFRPIIQNIIDSNKKFYCFNNKIEWDFFDNPNIAIMALIDKDLKLNININSVIHAYDINEPLQIEYFILHEIRHIYQRRIVFEYQLNKNNCPNREFAQQCEYEFNHYINMNEDKERYYSQQIEHDAYLFSYSVMLYKYGKISYINPPEFYENLDVKSHIEKWITVFKNQAL